MLSHVKEVSMQCVETRRAFVMTVHAQLLLARLAFIYGIRTMIFQRAH
jgi:hypothetical protein